MIALIDADIVMFRVGFTTEAESEGIARARTNEMLETILAETKADEYECWISDDRENNFRSKMYPAYKANRVIPRPKNYEAIKEHLVKEWGARFAYGMEADDALGIAQSTEARIKFGLECCDTSNDWAEAQQHTTVICSIDKDLLQIPGLHYNFVKKALSKITPWDGLKWFYKQILIGDVSDNIKGCKGIGEVKAGKAIDQILQQAGELEVLKAVYSCYQRQEKAWSSEEIVKQIQFAGSLLKIKTEEDEPRWDSLSLPLMEELRLSFTPQKVEVIIQSTEPTTLEVQNPAGFQSLGKPMDISSSMESTAAST